VNQGWAATCEHKSKGIPWKAKRRRFLEGFQNEKWGEPAKGNQEVAKKKGKMDWGSGTGVVIRAEIKWIQKKRDTSETIRLEKSQGLKFNRKERGFSWG